MERYNITVKENPFDGCPYADMVVSDDGAYMRYDDAKRALDAERANRLAMEACVDRDVKAIKDLKAQLATLQAQLRQVEGEREAHAQDVDELIDRCINDVLVTHATPGGKPHDPDPQIRPLRDKIAGSLVELQTLRQLVEALPVVDVQEVSVWLSPDESGWLVSKRPAFPAGLYWAKFRTQAEADSFRALLAYRATLAAQDAGKEDVSHD